MGPEPSNHHSEFNSTAGAASTGTARTATSASGSSPLTTSGMCLLGSLILLITIQNSTALLVQQAQELQLLLLQLEASVRRLTLSDRIFRTQPTPIEQQSQQCDCDHQRCAGSCDSSADSDDCHLLFPEEEASPD